MTENIPAEVISTGDLDHQTSGIDNLKQDIEDKDELAILLKDGFVLLQDSTLNRTSSSKSLRFESDEENAVNTNYSSANLRFESDEENTVNTNSMVESAIETTVQRQNANFLTSDPLDSIRIRALESSNSRLQSEIKQLKSDGLEVLNLLQSKYKFSDDYLKVMQ